MPVERLVFFSGSLPIECFLRHSHTNCDGSGNVIQLSSSQRPTLPDESLFGNRLHRKRICS